MPGLHVQPCCPLLLLPAARDLLQDLGFVFHLLLLAAPRAPPLPFSRRGARSIIFLKLLDFSQTLYSPKPIEIHRFNVYWSRVAQFLVFGFLLDTDFFAFDVN